MMRWFTRATLAIAIAANLLLATQRVAAERDIPWIILSGLAALVLGFSWFQLERRWNCQHDWFPDLEPSEFLPIGARCLECGASRMYLPYGQCLGGHPLAEHYDEHAEIVEHPTCPGPR